MTRPATSRSRWSRRTRRPPNPSKSRSPAAAPQRPAYPLNRSERVAILFPQEGAAPIVLALRTDFPDTPHQNWVPEQIPACLCVDDRPWVEARLTYTAGQLLFRILNWFKLA